ncbi:MAG: FHA domain-containing protein [Candidatus Aminicenantes bacterium]|nr:FHA domain-containing protein [Candidatus Aminicenantes bacterium]
MKKQFMIFSFGIILIAGFLFAPAFSAQEWIKDICEKPDRYQNLSVTVVGQVLDATSDPEGTTRGFYTFVDESCSKDENIKIRTTDLPAAGKMYKVKGVVMTDATDGSVYIKEISRSAPGMPSWMIILLIGAGILFLVLLIILVVVLVKPKGAPKSASVPPAPTFRPEPRPAAQPAPPAPAAGPAPTRKVETPYAPPPPSAPEPDKTRAFLSLRAEILIEKGPDEGKTHTFHKQVTTIGRGGSRKNDVELSDDTVSKEQSSIFYDNTTKEFSIRNESTTNPTQVNQKIVTDPVILKNNDLIEVGASALRFKKE